MDELQRKDDALFDALNQAKKKKRRRRLITILVIVAVVAAAAVLGINYLRKKVDARMSILDTAVLNATAEYGNVSTRVSGSGTIEDVDSEQITVPKGVKIEEVIVKSNNTLREGDVIATVDQSSVISTMASVQEKIDKLDEELKKASSDQASTVVSAGTNGRVKRVFIRDGDDVAACMVENGALALISLDGKLAVDFNNDSMQAGDAVQVELTDGHMLEGTVEKNLNGKATVLVSDNAADLDEEVRVLDADGKELGKGKLYIHSEFRITGFAGRAVKVSVTENEQIYPNSSICTLADTAYSARYHGILKQRREQEKTLLELLAMYQGGALRAPFDGTILSIDYKKDEKTSKDDKDETASASSAVSEMDLYSMMFGGSESVNSTGVDTTQEEAKTEEIKVVTMSPDVSMKVSVKIDEADILSVEIGQAAEVTIDSLPGQMFQGTVTDVDRTANSKAGVTSYSAEVTFDKGTGMLTGMTANVNINIVGTENVLLVPQDAVQRTSTGAFVYTEYDENTKTLGGEVPVEVGIENSDSAEIVSGIEEGTVVYYNEKPKDFMDIMMMSAYG